MLHSLFFDEDGSVLSISEKLMQTIKDSAEKWSQIDGGEREIEGKFIGGR